MKIFISRDGQQLGPYSVQQINAGAAFGSFTASDLAWIEGWANWQPLSMVPGFVSSVPPPPPNRPTIPEKTSNTPQSSRSPKRILPAFLLCLFFGALGIHAFYAGRAKQGFVFIAFFLAVFVFLSDNSGRWSLGASGSLAGLAFFWLSDFIRIIIGAYKDGHGEKITEWT